MTKEQIVTNFRIIMASNCLVSQAELEQLMYLALESPNVFENKEARAAEREEAKKDCYGNKL